MHLMGNQYSEIILQPVLGILLMLPLSFVTLSRKVMIFSVGNLVRILAIYGQINEIFYQKHLYNLKSLLIDLDSCQGTS